MGYQFIASAFRCSSNSSGRRVVSALLTGSWSSFKVVYTEGGSSFSCMEVLVAFAAHGTDDTASDSPTDCRQ